METRQTAQETFTSKTLLHAMMSRVIATRGNVRQKMTSASFTLVQVNYAYGGGLANMRSVILPARRNLTLIKLSSAIHILVSFRACSDECSTIMLSLECICRR